ncbi:hypothetical protein [Bifidobacterium sp. SO1]|uniref:hypothetical protein n=1 Tax=Bifidobacterium sp. SO1 TaxID=2809029 RepID=UPI001BDC5FEE|nr:hypothetical protein [Bifidobacterium sp. SO1]MBT1161844.1 hypothetical protein [Bifidobacterium sp. SO1]
MLIPDTMPAPRRVKTPSVYYCYRMLVDSIWKTARLCGANIGYDDAENIRYGQVTPGMRITDFDILQPAWGGWKRLYDDMSLTPFDGLWLDFIDPTVEVRALLDGLRDSEPEIILTTVWPHDHMTAILAANHRLLHADIGLLMPPAKLIEDAIARFDAGDVEWVHDHCIDKAPRE